jgi:CubicO group peptidase (beta-lactamase class C family)
MIAALAWLATGASAAAPLPGPAGVENLARSAMAETGAKGLAVALIDDGRVASVQAFGQRMPKASR